MKRCAMMFDTEALGGLVIATVLASKRKVEAGLRYAGSGKYQDYPPGIIELGVALDAINMMVIDVVDCIVSNTDINDV